MLRLPLTLGQPATFTLATKDQWFLVELPIGHNKFTFDAAQANGESTNLIYQVDVLDRFGAESRAKW